MAEWTPRLTRGLWSAVQGAVRDGLSLADVRGAMAGIGETPDASTLSHLYSRAVGGEYARGREADYRASVDRDLYLGRRPGGANIATLPRGWTMLGRWRQVVKVTGRDTVTGREATQYVNVQFDRLLTRGEAIDLAMQAVVGGVGRYRMTAEAAEYDATWGLE